MSATNKTTFFWSDWLGDPAVRRLSPAARGLWIDCLALMASAQPYGVLVGKTGAKFPIEYLARLANCDSKTVKRLLQKILDAGVASVDEQGRIYSRRMVRDKDLEEKRRAAGKVGAVSRWGAPAITNGMAKHAQNSRRFAMANQDATLKERKINPSFPSETEPREAKKTVGEGEPDAAQNPTPTPQLPERPPLNLPTPASRHDRDHAHPQIDPDEGLRGYERHAARQARLGLDPLRVRTAEECAPSPYLAPIVQGQNLGRGFIPDLPQAPATAAARGGPQLLASPLLLDLIQKKGWSQS